MMPIRFPRTPLTRGITLLSLSLPASVALFSTMTTSKAPSSSDTPSTPSTNTHKPKFPVRAYIPRHTTFPYTERDFLRADESDDTDFYSAPRFVTHIDDNAIALLRQYYAAILPRKGRAFDLCSSWISHFPKELEGVARAGKTAAKGNEGEGLEVVGLGTNKRELDANPILKSSILQNLNVNPSIPASLAPLDATTCVVSIDYLTKPIAVLSTLLQRTKEGGTVHLIISNRCFPTKAVGRWLRGSEEERLQMVGDYLWFSGWREVEIVEVCDGRGSAPGLMGMCGGGVDPLWVVRGVKTGEGPGEGQSEEGRSEL